jgi:cell division topological specificity factor MinE
MEFLHKIGFLNRLFGGPKDESRNAAKERLKGALVGDRSSVAPNLLPSLQAELSSVLERYFRYDCEMLKMQLNEREGQMTFGVQLPVTEVHRQAKLPDEALRDKAAERKHLLQKPQPRRLPSMWSTLQGDSPQE